MTHNMTDLVHALLPLIGKGDHMGQADVLGSMGARIHLMIDNASSRWGTHACLYSLGTLSYPSDNKNFAGRIRLIQPTLGKRRKGLSYFHPTYHQPTPHNGTDLSTEKDIYEYMHEGLYDDLATFLGEHGFTIRAFLQPIDRNYTSDTKRKYTIYTPSYDNGKPQICGYINHAGELS